ncbi:MAG TPA: heparan-alpha-glucosaminide N-acetyltransferase domain-containing protein [Gemmatimonadaceae bacterium]|nr:heparan-alpha-glucosaminide N-acetyltransferase domain-containing protein [Gemmatimonadaceae bacterium]
MQTVAVKDQLGATYWPLTTSAPSRAVRRILSIDIARGVAMILMAIDHVRVYAGVPPGGPNPGVFFTRWITNFVAPAFAFLSGTSAYLLGRKLGSTRALSRYLLTRGLILVLLELTLIRVAWTFNFRFGDYLLAGVIWMLGWCMVLMSALVWLPVAAIGAFGVAVIFLHNVMDFVAPRTDALGQGGLDWLWQILYYGGPIQLGDSGPTLAVLYSIVPWIGVMAAGYAFGALMTMEQERRDRMCVLLGVASIVLFFILRGVDVYGDPRHWSTASPVQAPTFFRFINTTKYPASLQFLLMTLGPMLLLMPLFDRARGKIGEFVATFGRVPMFYYLLHIPAIHLAAVIVSLVREHRVDSWLFDNHPMMNPPPPQDYMWSLLLLYAVWAMVIAVLYFPSRWYWRQKSTRPAWWMKYV